MVRFLIMGILYLPFCSLIGQTDSLFWFVAPEVQQSHGDRPIALRLSSTGQAAQVVVDIPANPVGFPPIAVNLAPNTTQSIDLTPWIDIIENRPANTILQRGIRVISSVPITAYYEVITSCNCNPDIFTLKGRNALGTSFMLPFQTSLNNGVANAWSGFDIVATENNTSVTITPTSNIVGHAAGVPFTVLLNAGQTWCGESMSAAASMRPVGTTVVSDRPIAITIKDDSMNGGSYGGCADLMGDQLVPLSIIGTEYISIKGYLNGPDLVYIMATQNNTVLNIDGNQVATLNAGQSYTHVQSANTAYMVASLPVYVLQTTGFGCEFGGAVLPPIVCTGSTQIGFTRSTTEFFALNLLVPAGGEGNFLLNNNPTLITAANFNDVPGSGGNWKFAQIPYNTAQVANGTASLLTNSSDKFHMAVINGGASSGCRFGYFSDYASFRFQAQASADSACQGASITLTAGNIPGAAYSWTGPNNFNSTNQQYIFQNADSSLSGYYYLTGTVGTCPVVSDSVYVFVQNTPMPAVAGSNAPVCSGNNWQLSSVGQSGSIFQWSGPGGFSGMGDTLSFIASTQQSGTYTVTPWLNNCPGNPTSILVQIDTLSFGLLSTNPSCGGLNNGSIAMVPILGSPGYQYNWSGGLPSVSQQNQLAPGNYTLVVVDANGCIDSASVTLTAPPVLTGTILSTAASCHNRPDGSASIVASGGTPGYQYVWNNGSNSVQVNQILPGWYSVTITDSLNCVFVDSVLVPSPPPLSPVLASLTDPICHNDQNGTGLINSIGGAGFISYLWSSSMETSNPAVQLAWGSQTVTVWDSAGCDSLLIPFTLINPAPVVVTASASPQPLCQGESVTFSALGANTYSWSGPGIINQTNAQFSFVPTQGGTWQVVGQDALGCLDSTTLSFDLLLRPQALFTASDVCVNDTLFLDASGSLAPSPEIITQYFWDSDGDGQSDFQSTVPQHLVTYSQSGATTLRLWISNSLGCLDTFTINLVVHPLPGVSLTPGNTCFGFPFIPQNQTVGGSSYSWDMGDGVQYNIFEPIHSYTDTGNYVIRLIAISAEGCRDTLLYPLSILPQPDFLLLTEEGCFGKVTFTAVQLLGQPIESGYWIIAGADTLLQNPDEFTFSSPGTYTYTFHALSPNGCNSSFEETITPEFTKTWEEFEFPTIITPNNDGLNDALIFDLDLSNCYPFELVVYNRWGVMLHRQTEVEGLPFNGLTSSGSSLPDGVYFYLLKVGSYSHQGVLQIVR